MAEILHIQRSTRVLGQRQGYIGLPLRDEFIHDIGTLRDELFFDRVAQRTANAMHTAWALTPDELRAHIDGAPLILRVLGTMHPPVMLYVGDA